MLCKCNSWKARCLIIKECIGKKKMENKIGIDNSRMIYHHSICFQSTEDKSLIILLIFFSRSLCLANQWKIQNERCSLILDRYRCLILPKNSNYPRMFSPLNENLISCPWGPNDSHAFKVEKIMIFSLKEYWWWWCNLDDIFLDALFGIVFGLYIYDASLQGRASGNFLLENS